MSAGALHPVELYVATSARLSHYHPGDGMLYPLRDEEARGALAASAAAPELSDAAAVLILTGILWRTAWTYGARGWRHVLWDAGAMLANLLAVAANDGPRLFTAFVDGEVARTLGVDAMREAPAALVAVGTAERASGPTQLGPLDHESPPLSQREQRFTDAEAAQTASSLAHVEEVIAWRERAGRFDARSAGGEPPRPLERVILRRGSARDFTRDEIGSDQLRSMLAWACSPVPGDLPPLCSILVVAHAVAGLEPGAYRFESPDRFETMRKGADRRVTAHLCLDQPHGGNAAAALFFTVNLDSTLATLGDRGYRAAQLDAGILAGRTSLGAYARGLAATGLTFFDDEVRRFLGTEEEPMMCLAVGVDARSKAR
jgi:hypothetical protein